MVIMLPLIILILSLVITDGTTKPTTESTHVMLQRLGFDQVQRPAVNHHRKRVAQETNKARHHIDSYNTETDSHMYIVKLPPHSPYYSHMTPEKFENEVVSKSSANFRTNGKPAGVYHWNIPVIKGFPQARYSANQLSQGDSKVYHVKILPNEYHKGYKEKGKPHYSKFNKFKKQRYEDRAEAPTPTKDNFTSYPSVINVRKDGGDGTAKKAQERGRIEFTKLMDANDVPSPHWTKSKNYPREKLDHIKSRNGDKEKWQRGPSYYQPALPKQNSFHKGFTGNGKPKSFYVIEKSKKATRYHRLF